MLESAWLQNSDPFGCWPLSTLVASLPVLVLLGLLASGKVSAWKSALAGLGMALAAAIGGFHMPPRLAFAAAGAALVFAFFRIIWLVVSAVFLYDIAVATGQFTILKASIAQLSGDRRIQAVLVAFCLGAIIEGAAGFGAPVAITAALLVGLGFRPFPAALVCLIANTAPVAWGSIGVPIGTLAKVTGLNVEAISATSGRIIPLLAFLIPFWLVAVLAGLRAMRAVWPALVVIGGTFAAAKFIWSNGAVCFGLTFTSYELVDMVAAVSSLWAGVVLLRFWRPREEWHFPDEEPLETTAANATVLTFRQIARAWMPFALLTVMVIIWGIPVVKQGMARPHPLFGSSQVIQLDQKVPMPGLHLQVARSAAVTGHAATEKDLIEADLEIVPVSSTGTAVFIAAVLSGLLAGARPAQMAVMFLATVRRLTAPIVAIFAMLALGFVTKYAGMDAVLGLAFTRVGPGLYPIFGTLLGWLGVALTGSDTSSNVLFGNLQTITARKLGLSPILMAAANTSGGVMGKMIAAQSIVVATAATGQSGEEGKLLRAVFAHSLALAFLVGLLVWAYAHVWPGVVVTLTGP